MSIGQIRRLALCTLAGVVHVLGFVGAAAAQYSPPAVTVPIGEEPPGAWPFTVTGAVFDIAPVAGSTLGGTGSDNLFVEVRGFGPSKWTESRHNEGDIAVVIGPNDTSFESDPPSPFDNYQAAGGPTTHAWRVNRDVGIPWATVRANGRDNGDFLSDGVTPVGTFYGTAHFSAGFSQGNAYDMRTGAFTNGGGGASDLLIGFAGNPDEANIDVGMAFLPYGQGWVGGMIDSLTIGAEGESAWFGDSFSPALGDMPPVVWSPTGLGDFTIGKARVSFPDYDPTTGMLLVASTDSDSHLAVLAAHPNDGGWDVAIREDRDFDTTGQTLSLAGAGGDSDSDFQFVYVDYAAPRLVGGHIDGLTGASLTGAAGDFTLVRTGVGRYELTVPGKTDTDGMLILSGAGLLPGSTDLASRAFYSYEYDDGSGRFVIEARQAVGGGPDPSGGTFPLVDGDFYFVWVDFNDPLQPWPDGDANLDGTTGRTDAAFLLRNLGATTDSTWMSADFDFDGTVTLRDLAILQSGLNAAAAPGALSVPEPAGVTSAFLAIGFALLIPRRARR